MEKNHDKKLFKKPQKLLRRYRINSQEDLKPPKTALEVLKNGKAIPILTLGNFSLVIGKAKSKKSFLISWLISVMLSNNQNLLSQFYSRLSKDKKVLYFDTEQGKYHGQVALKRICRLIRDANPKRLKMYCLRSLKPKERLELIEFAIYNDDEIGVVFIDGIKDLITSINSEEEATEIASKLLKWTEERNIHIVCVLHQNKGDNNARGHLGSELTHKSETVVSVSKSQEDKDISIVQAEMCRNEEPDPFAFEIIDGLPVQVENYEERAVTKKKKPNVLDMPHYQMFKLLTEVYSSKNEYMYGELNVAIKTAYKKQLKKPLADRPTRDLINYMKNMNWLLQDNNRGAYKLGQYDTKAD